MPTLQFKGKSPNQAEPAATPNDHQNEVALSSLLSSAHRNKA